MSDNQPRRRYVADISDEDQQVADAIAFLEARGYQVIPAPSVKSVPLSEAIKAIRAAGGSDWDKIDDPEEYLGRRDAERE
jgi:hypothetical protein